MIFRPELLDQLEQARARPYSGNVFRHVLGTNDPVRPNTRGARWNPAGISALYTSLSREVALAEGDFLLAAQPLRPRVARSIFEIGVSLRSVIELDDTALAALGISSEILQSLLHAPCQEVGGAVHWLGHDGLIIPSARGGGQNLVIYTSHQEPGDEFEILRQEAVVDA